jgi:hypothetical protein
MLVHQPCCAHCCVAHSIDEPPVFSTCAKTTWALAPGATAHGAAQHCLPHQCCVQKAPFIAYVGCAHTSGGGGGGGGAGGGGERLVPNGARHAVTSSARRGARDCGKALRNERCASSACS